MITIVVWDHYPYDRKHEPSSDLFSSIVDYSQWLLMQMNGGVLHNKRVLQPASQALMWEPLFWFDQATGDGYGWGWSSGPINGRPCKGSFGGGPGIMTSAVLAPQEGLASIVFSNLNDISPSFDGYWTGDLCIWALQQMLEGVF